MRLTGSPNHQPAENMDSTRLYQNSVSVTGSQKFYDMMSSVIVSGRHVERTLAIMPCDSAYRPVL